MYTRGQRLAKYSPVTRQVQMGGWVDDVTKLIQAGTQSATQVINTVTRPTWDDLSQRAGVSIPQAASYTPMLLAGAALLFFMSKRR